MNYVSQITAALTLLGLTIGGLLTALGTVIASFLAARFGASESRRQYVEKSKLDKLVAAGELIQILHKFQDELQDLISDCENHKSSGGHAGEEHYGFGIKLSGKPHRLAAVLGPRVVEDVIVLMAKFARAKGNVAGIWEFADPSSTSEELQKWSAAIIVDTIELINKVNAHAGIRINAKSSMDYEKLIEMAGDRAADDEYTNLIKY
jgi:hypothetical protein